MSGSKQYPAQTGTYAVKVKNGRGWDAYDTARFQISVGQEYHEGEKFKATMEWAKHRFKHVLICVNDTLQRHNYYDDPTMAGLPGLKRSEMLGREWIERNIATIRRLPSFEILRWEEWRAKPEYHSEYAFVSELYARDKNVREMVELNVYDFWKRRQKNADENYEDFLSFKLASTDYLLEETAVFFQMFKRDHAVDIYPGSVLLPCVLAEQYFSGERVRGLGERAFTRIDFSRNRPVANMNESSS